MPLDDGAGAGMQVAGAGVVAEPLPLMQHLVERGRGERAKYRASAPRIGQNRAPTVATVVCCSMISLSQTR